MVQSYPTGSGQYDQRITIEVDTATITDVDVNGAQLEIWDAAGSSFVEWSSFSIIPSRPGGAEYFLDDKRVVENKALFRVRRKNSTIGIGPASHRVNYDGRIWNIQRAYDPDGKRVEIHLETNSIT